MKFYGSTRRHIPQDGTLPPYKHVTQQLVTTIKYTALQAAKFLVVSSPHGHYAVPLWVLNLASYFQTTYITVSEKKVLKETLRPYNILREWKVV